MPGIFEEVGARAVLAGAAQYISQAQRVEAATASIGRSATQLAKNSDALSVSLSRAGSRMQEISGQATILGAAISAPAIAAATFALSFEQAMLRVSTLSGVAAEDIAGLREQVLQLSGRTAQAPQALAEALLAITSTGLRGAEAMEVLEQSAKAAAVGLGDVETVGRTITGILKAYEAQGIDAARASDVLFATVREGGAEADEVAGAFGRVTGIAATFGVTLEEVGAFVATFTRLGVSADEAVTALRGTITSIFAPAQQTADALAKFNLSSEQLRRTVVDKGLLAALQDIIEATNGDTEALDAIIPNVRALAGVLGTAGSQAEGYKAVIDAVTESQGLLDSAFEQTASGPAFRLQQALADIQRALVEMGAAVLPALVPLFDALSQLASAFAELPAPVQQLLGGTLLLSGALLTLAGSVGFVFGGLLRLTPLIRILIPLIGGLTAIMAANPLVLAAIALGAVAAGAAYLIFRDSADEAAEAEERLTLQARAAQAAQEESAESLQEKINALHASRDAAREELRILELYGAETKFNTERTKELTEAFESEGDELAALQRAQHLQALAQQLGVQGLTDLKKEQEDVIQSKRNLIASLEDQVRVNEENGRSTVALLAQIRRLRGEEETATNTLLEANAALGIAQRQFGATGDAARGAATRISAVGDSAIETTRKLAGLSAEALATMVVLNDLAALNKFARDTSEADFTGFEQLSPEEKAIDILKRAEAVRARIEAATTQITNRAGFLTPEQERAGSRASDDAAREAERAAEEALREQERIAEEAARIAAESLEAAQQARERIAQQTLADLDQLGDLIVAALRAQAEEELAVTIDGINRARDFAQRAHEQAIERLEDQRDAAIRAAEEQRDGVIAAIEAETRAVIDGINAQIEALDAAGDAETRAEIVREIALSFDPKDRADAEARLRDFDRRQQQDALRAQAQAVQEDARERIDLARETTQTRIDEIRAESEFEIQTRRDVLERAIELFDAQEDAARRTYAAATREFTLQSKARELVIAGETEAIAKLLDAHVPEWRTAGLSFGQQLIDGLRASGVEQYINDLLARASRITGGGAGGNPSIVGAVGGPAAAAAAASTISAEQAAAQVIQDNGRAMVIAGAPQVAIQDLRDYLTSQGIVPEFARGLDMGMVRSDTLAGLHAGERVVTPEQWEALAGPRVNFEAGAFDGFLRGATLAGDPRENARAIRRELEQFSERQLGRDAFLFGV